MRTFLGLLFLFLTATAFAQNRSEHHHHRATIYYDNPEQLARLDRLGVAVDHGAHKRGYSVTSDFSDAELALVAAEGLDYEVLIKNVGQYYRDRNNPASQHYIAPPRQASGTTASAAKTVTGCGQEDAADYPTPANYNNGSMGGFLTYSEMLQELDDMYAYSEANGLGIITRRADNINPAAPEDLRTEEGRYQQWVMMSNNAEGPSTNQPQVFYNAIHHAREPASLQQLIFFMWYLLENYETSAEVRDIVDNTELYFMPCVNPDGYLYNEFLEPDGGAFWRKNRRGGYGVDNNRNYHYITPEGESTFATTDTDESQNGQTYPGTAPFSEPENRGTRYFTETHDFTITLNNHTSGGLLLYPFGYADDERTPDDAIFRAISAEMVSENGYADILSSELYPASGDSDDFGYGFLQTADGGTREPVFSMTPEIGPSFWPPEALIEDICKDMVLHNLRAAQFTGVYGKVTDITPPIVNNTTAYLGYELVRLGFQQGPLTVYAEAVSDNVTIVGEEQVLGGLQHAASIIQEIEIALDADIRPGESFTYDLVIDNGRGENRQRITKLFGVPTVVLTEEVDNLARWTTDTWGLTDEDFHPNSPSTSLTDSPGGDYDNGRNDAVEFTELIDLTEEGLVDAQLQFYARWAIEPGYDLVQVQVAREGTNQWIPLCGRYTTTGVENQFVAVGEPLYDGFSDWTEETMSLTDFLGERLRLRLYIFSDQGVTEDGFYFDGMRISTLRSIPVSVDPTPLDDRFSVFPNPATDRLTIATDLAAYDLVLRDVLGRTVRTAAALRGRHTLTVGDLEPGVYLLTLRAEGAERAVRVVIR